MGRIVSESMVPTGSHAGAPGNDGVVTKARPPLIDGFLSASAVFALALCIRLSLAFLDGHGAIVFACDASEYLRDAEGLARLFCEQSRFMQFLKGLEFLICGTIPSVLQAHELRQAFEPVKELAIAGPVFPLFLWASCSLCGVAVSPANWFAPVLCQSLLTSLTCVLIGRIGTQTWSRPVGIAAGALAAFYPGFIVNSLRMYSESFSCFWLCLVISLWLSSRESPWHGPADRNLSKWQHGAGLLAIANSLFSGISLAVLQVTRSVMVVVTGLIFAFSLIGTTKYRWQKMVWMIAGMVLVLAPWLVFQQIAFGKCSLLVDRVGHYNLWIGTNISTQGWLSYPYPDGTGIESRSYADIVKKQLNASPGRFMALMCDKPLRLFKFPWNDFRTPIGPFNMPAQVIFHEALLVLAAIGLALAFFVEPGPRPGAESLLRRGVLLTLFAVHGIYLMFITVPRYNLTSMPFVILFAAAGLVSLARISAKRPLLAGGVFGAVWLSLLFCHISWSGDIFLPSGLNGLVASIVATSIKAAALISLVCLLLKAIACCLGSRKPAYFLTLSLALVLIPLCALPLRGHGRWYETRLSPTRADPVRQTIFIPEHRFAALTSRPCYLLVDCCDWQTLGNGSQVRINNILLQTPAIPVLPFIQDFALAKSNGVSMGAEEHYVEFEKIFSFLMTASGGSNMDLRQWFIVPIPAGLIADAISSRGGRLDVELVCDNAKSGGIFATYANPPGEVRIPSLDRASWEKAFYGVENINGLSDCRYDQKVRVLPPAHPDASPPACVANVRLLVAPPHAKSSSPRKFLIVCGKGRLSGALNTGVLAPVSMSLTAESIDGRGRLHVYRSPWTPASVLSRSGGKDFSFAAPIGPGVLPGKVTRVSLVAKNGGVAAGNELFGAGGGGLSPPSNRPYVESLSLSCSYMDVNPIGIGFEVF